MTQINTPQDPERRSLLVGLGAGGLAVVGMTLVPRAVLADADSMMMAIKERIGDTATKEGRISLELPQIAENGNTVPVAFEIDSPMTESDYVKAVHLFAEKNPLPNVASFRFTPRSGKARASTRMREDPERRGRGGDERRQCLHGQDRGQGHHRRLRRLSAGRGEDRWRKSSHG
jgi:sulfur-oxidizing protein SoxY